MEDETELSAPALHPAVELLLARMKSNPDEFSGNGAPYTGSSWRTVTDRYNQFFSKEERKAIQNAWRDIMLQGMHEEIMKRLTAPPAGEDNAKRIGVPVNNMMQTLGSGTNPYGMAQQVMSLNTNSFDDGSIEVSSMPKGLARAFDALGLGKTK